ncbi:MAG: hypothetical protein ACRDMA_11580 [Solirubrobacterales bacterium]
MGKVVEQRTPGLEHAFDALQGAVDAEIRGDPLYPNHAAFVATDMAASGQVVKRYRSEGRPVVLVFPDGETELLTPRDEFTFTK